MFLFCLFVIEYLLGEAAYEIFDGWFYALGDWHDLNSIYYIVVGFIDVAVMSILLRGEPRLVEIAYATLATLSFFVNAGGLYVYLTEISDVFYLSVMQTILVLKLMLVFNRTLSHARVYARGVASRINHCVVNSLLCLYIWEMVKTNQEKG